MAEAFSLVPKWLLHCHIGLPLRLAARGGKGSDVVDKCIWQPAELLPTYVDLEMESNAFEMSVNVATHWHSFLTMHSSMIHCRAMICWMVDLPSQWPFGVGCSRPLMCLNVVEEYPIAWQQVTWVQCPNSFHALKHLHLFLWHYSYLKPLGNAKLWCKTLNCWQFQCSWTVYTSIFFVEDSQLALAVSVRPLECKHCMLWVGFTSLTKQLSLLL